MRTGRIDSLAELGLSQVGSAAEGRRGSIDATGSHHRSLLVRENEDGSIDYLVGASATSSDGWASLPADLVPQVEWNVSTCVYCNSAVSVVSAPQVSDDVAWSALAAEHAADCEWIETRAHRRFASA